MSNSPGLVDFAIGLRIFVLNLPDTQVLFLGKFKLQKDCNQSCKSKRVLGLVEMTCGLVHASYSLPEWQAVKLTFFAPWLFSILITWIVAPLFTYCYFKSWLWQVGCWGWLPRLTFICQPSLSPVMITWWNSDWEVFGAICSQSHSLKYLRECAAGSLRLRTCSTKAHSSAMGVLMGWKCRYIETPMAGEWA